MNDDSKIVFFPPKELKNIAPTYEAEKIEGYLRVYRRLSVGELSKYYLVSGEDVDIIKKRIYLFTKNSIEEVEDEINSYYKVIGSLYSINC